MKERLVELLSKHQKICNENCTGLEKSCYRCSLEQLADYILADGWTRPPCKVGDKVYVVDYTRLGNMIFDCTIEEISHFTYGTYYYLNWGLHIPRFKACQENSFGKTVFLTREDAESKLKEGGEG